MRATPALYGTLLLLVTAALLADGHHWTPAVHRPVARKAHAAAHGHFARKEAAKQPSAAKMTESAPTPAPASAPAAPSASAAAPLQGWTIVIDPGHGRDPRYGTYTGAMGVNGVSEDQNVLDIGQRLGAQLRAQGATVYMTRGVYDPAPPPVDGLIKRVDLAEAVHANLYISIHENDGTATDHGVQTWYYWPYSLPLAEDLQQAMVTDTGLANAGIHQKGFYVVYHTTMPAVLVEGGFLSNPSEAALISTQAFHAKEAAALDAAILAYATSYPKY